MQVHLCIPVLNRYDLLRNELLSLRASTVPVDVLCIVDNGRNPEALKAALTDTIIARVHLKIHTPAEPMGLAAAWNWMILNTADERIIANDDLEFAPGSVQAMIDAPGDLISVDDVSMCSCFLLRDSCVGKVGLFDELISPGYAYFEDNDYAERMFDAQAIRTNVQAGVVHKGSQTREAYTQEELVEHSRKFCIAEENFVKKWGFHPRDHRPDRSVWEPAPITGNGGGRRL